MKPITNNMAGLTDNLDKAVKFGNFENEKGPIYFTGKSHHNYYNRMIRETETGAEDRENLSLFYILSSIKKFRDAPGKFLFLKNIRPNPQAFRELLSREEQALIQLAFYLYSGKDIFKIGVLDLFNNLDEERADIAIDAIKLRYDIKIH